MRREALGLIGLMFIGSFLMAACEPKDEKSVVVAPSVAAAAPHSSVGTPTAAESKDGAVPVQGQVDPKEQAQKRDFEQKK